MLSAIRAMRSQRRRRFRVGVGVFAVDVVVLLHSVLLGIVAQNGQLPRAANLHIIMFPALLPRRFQHGRIAQIQRQRTDDARQIQQRDLRQAVNGLCIGANILDILRRAAEIMRIPANPPAFERIPLRKPFSSVGRIFRCQSSAPLSNPPNATR